MIFDILICHLYIFFGKVSVKIFGQFLIALFVCLMLHFKSCLDILENIPLSQGSFANIFSLSMAYPFTLLTGSYIEQKSLGL